MASIEGFGFGDRSKTVRKKRSNLCRRPRNDSQPFPDYHDGYSLSSTPPSDSLSKASSDENTGHNTNSWRKEIDINQFSSRASYTNLSEARTAMKIRNKDTAVEESNETQVMLKRKGNGSDSKSSNEGVVNVVNENKLKKVKLKVGGVTHTIHAKSPPDGASVGSFSSAKSSHSSDSLHMRPRLILQDNSDEDNSSSPDKGSILQRVPWKGFLASGVRNISDESVSVKLSHKYEPVRKSKRVPKKRVFGGEYHDGDDNEYEIQYLGKPRTSEVSVDYSAEHEDEVGSKKQKKISRVSRRNGDGRYRADAGDYGSSRLGKESKKFRSGRAYEDTDYMEEEELVSDGEPENRWKKERKESLGVLGDTKREMAITTRQRALQNGKDISLSSGASLIEFPNGLPPAPPKKQKDKLSEVEQQLKKAEAAQRRRMQVEKAARESEAEAIRRILGQDSSRKKREDKIKKRQEELAQERSANAVTLASNTVRWVMGPMGTVVTFPSEMGLPSIFESKPDSYPPPREKCAGPSCMNPYKYRDSRSRLPLCSLQCYKAIQEKMQPVTAC